MISFSEYSTWVLFCNEQAKDEASKIESRMFSESGYQPK